MKRGARDDKRSKRQRPDDEVESESSSESSLDDSVSDSASSSSSSSSESSSDSDSDSDDSRIRRKKKRREKTKKALKEKKHKKLRAAKKKSKKAKKKHKKHLAEREETPEPVIVPRLKASMKSICEKKPELTIEELNIQIERQRSGKHAEKQRVTKEVQIMRYEECSGEKHLPKQYRVEKHSPEIIKKKRHYEDELEPLMDSRKERRAAVVERSKRFEKDRDDEEYSRERDEHPRYGNGRNHETEDSQHRSRGNHQDEGNHRSDYKNQSRHRDEERYHGGKEYRDDRENKYDPPTHSSSRNKHSNYNNHKQDDHDKIERTYDRPSHTSSRRDDYQRNDRDYQSRKEYSNDRNRNHQDDHRSHDDPPSKYRQRENDNENKDPTNRRPSNQSNRNVMPQRSSNRDRNSQRDDEQPSTSFSRESRKFSPRKRERDNGDESKTYEWGKKDKQASDKPTQDKADKDKPNFGLSGKLAEDTNTVNGVVLKYSEPAEGRKPKRRWRLYPFKGETSLPILYIHRQSCFLLGRDRMVADIPLDHPSISKQHAVLQYRLVPFKREDGSMGKRIRPYVIDLGSSNGTFVNNKQIDPSKYVELLEKDVLKFGFSQREYVLLHENSKEEDMDDDDDVKLNIKSEDDGPESKKIKTEPED